MSRPTTNSRNRAPLSRVTRCGSKGGGSQYDPQVGAAAEQSASNARDALQFSQNYYSTTVKPLVEAETARSKQTMVQQDQLFGLNMKQAQNASDQYDTYGKPANTAYYNMVNKYSAPQEQESEAQAAIGDMRTSEASTAASLQRQQQSLGINPNSGAAMALASDTSTRNAGAEAAAATRARYNAKTMGMQLTADAANFSNTGLSALASTSGSASGNASGALGAAATATQGGQAGASVPMAGYGLASAAYGNNLDAYSRMASADIQASAAADSGLGQFLGMAGKAAMSFLPSDRRVKRNIVRLGTTPRLRLPVYAFDYIWGGPRRVGVMADEVEQVLPSAVATHACGFKMVDYGQVR